MRRGGGGLPVSPCRLDPDGCLHLDPPLLPHPAAPPSGLDPGGGPELGQLRELEGLLVAHPLGGTSPGRLQLHSRLLCPPQLPPRQEPPGGCLNVGSTGACLLKNKLPQEALL